MGGSFLIVCYKVLIISCLKESSINKIGGNLVLCI
jgi:hypothetical protein